jgi:hypothetical protein
MEQGLGGGQPPPLLELLEPPPVELLLEAPPAELLLLEVPHPAPLP